MPEEFNIGGTNYTVKDFLYNPGLVVKHGLSTFVDSLSRQRAGAVSISLIITRFHLHWTSTDFVIYCTD